MKKNNAIAMLFKSVVLVTALATTACSKNETLQVSEDESINNSNKSNGVTLASGEVVRLSDGNWRASVNGVQRYLGSDYIASINAAIGGLTAGRTTKEWITIKNSGSSGNSGGSVKAVNMQSYTGLDFSGTTFTCNSNDLLIVPVQADRKTQIEVKNLKVAGNPRYGIWFKGCTNMVISNITMNLTNGSGQYGLGIRVDNSTAATKTLTINGTQTFTGGDMHIETYGLDGFSIGNVTTSNNYGCGVLLNQSKNGSVGTVTGNRNCNGGGYATFRVANNNGPNVTCSKVYSRSSGRGFFSVSGSTGTTVSTVDIASCTSHGVFLENATSTYVNGGTVSGCNPNVQHVNASSCATKVNGQNYTSVNGKW